MKKKNERKRNAVDVSSDDHTKASGVFSGWFLKFFSLRNALK